MHGLLVEITSSGPVMVDSTFYLQPDLILMAKLLSNKTVCYIHITLVLPEIEFSFSFTGDVYDTDTTINIFQ